MDEARIIRGIAESERILERFGRWPAFHDAEIVSLACLASSASFDVEMTLEVPWLGETIRVAFAFDGCDARPGTWLAGFEGRNALFALDWTIEEDEDRILATLRPIASDAGLEGRICCRRVRVLAVETLADA